PSLYAVYKEDIPTVNKKGLVLGGGSGNGVPTEWFSRDKGFYEIAEVTRELLQKYTQVKLIMLGKVEDEAFFKEFEDLLVSGQVSHVDAISDIRPYLMLADIHLFLTHREGFGNVAIEAASMEVPTIAFDVVGVKDSVVEGISGLKFPLGDNVRVFESICSLIDNPDLLNELSKKAREWATENYSQEK